METRQGKKRGILIGGRLVPYENEWVALDKNKQVIAHAERLPELLENLTPEQVALKPSFMQVLPHNVSYSFNFAS